MIFTGEGNIGRLQYVLNILWIFLFYFITSFIIYLFFPLPEWYVRCVLLIPTYLLTFWNIKKRVNSFGYSSSKRNWTIAFCFIPIVNLYFVALLLFKKAAVEQKDSDNESSGLSIIVLLIIAGLFLSKFIPESSMFPEKEKLRLDRIQAQKELLQREQSVKNEATKIKEQNQRKQNLMNNFNYSKDEFENDGKYAHKYFNLNSSFMVLLQEYKVSDDNYYYLPEERGSKKIAPMIVLNFKIKESLFVYENFSIKSGTQAYKSQMSPFIDTQAIVYKNRFFATFPVEEGLRLLNHICENPGSIKVRVTQLQGPNYEWTLTDQESQAFRESCYLIQVF